MNQKIRDIVIAKENVIAIGKFTIVEVFDGLGNRGIGLSIRSKCDKSNPQIGKGIAKGRALRGLYNRVKGKKPSNNMYCDGYLAKKESK